MPSELNRKITGSLTSTILLLAIAQALLGWLQLFGLIPSNHNLFPSTGTFYNPGPFCAFLAVTVPMALQAIIGRRSGFLHYLALISLILSLGLMPVLMGRTGWIAAIVGSLIVAAGNRKLPRLPRPVLLSLILGIIALFFLLILLKPESALGRLLLWIDGSIAALSSPLCGVGWSNVAGALGSVQETFFTSHPDSSLGAVAGSPAYAFNEFLQIAIAFGIPAMLGFISLLTFAILRAFRSRRFGIAGSLVAFVIISLASYPLQFPEFILLLAILLIAAIVPDQSRLIHPYSFPALLSAAIIILGAVCISALRSRSHFSPQHVQALIPFRPHPARSPAYTSARLRPLEHRVLPHRHLPKDLKGLTTIIYPTPKASARRPSV